MSPHNRNIRYWKMSGNGNDFIVIDNRRGLIRGGAIGEWVRRICNRGMSLGADGVILIEKARRKEVDFSWRYFNADGSEADMCGNGARCAARFAFKRGIALKNRMRFSTRAGVIEAALLGKGRVKVRLTEPSDIRTDLALSLPNGIRPIGFINTGVPHVVLEAADVEMVDVAGLGRTLRHHSLFRPAGTNVNFVQRLSPRRGKIRTYERGVEGETLACGTGAAAAALLGSLAGRFVPPVKLQTKSGVPLKVHFSRVDGDGAFTDIYLEGDARWISWGEMTHEAWDW